MGREQKVRKARKCPHCKKIVHMDSKNFSEHAAFCKRAQDIGIVLAGGIEMP